MTNETLVFRGNFGVERGHWRLFSIYLILNFLVFIRNY